MHVYRIGATNDFLYWDKSSGLYGIVYDGDDSKEQADLVKRWYASLDKARDEWEAKRGNEMENRWKTTEKTKTKYRKK